MKPHHVLILAATLLVGAGLYGVYSTPHGASAVGAVLTLLAPSVGAAIAIVFAVRVRRSDSERVSRAAAFSLLALAALLAAGAIYAAVTMHRHPPGADDVSVQTPLAESPTSNSTKGSFTVQRSVATALDSTHLVFATGFSAGVALLAAVTLAFLRACDADEASESRSLPPA